MSSVFHFTPGDADFINAASHAKEGLICNYKLKEYGFLTIAKDKKILGVAGVKLLNRFVAEFSFVADVVNIRKHNNSLHKEVKKLLNKFFTNSTYKRFQVWVDVGIPERTKWVERLGFEREATIKGVGEFGQDQYLYSKIVER